MNLSPRFALDTLFVIGAFLAVVAMALTAPVAGWTGFGVFTGLAVIALASALFGRGAVRKTSHGVLGLVGLWSLIATLLFTGTALTWLIFAGGVALAVIALADLAAHEVTTENVVHRLVVTESPAGAPADSRATAAGRNPNAAVRREVSMLTWLMQMTATPGLSGSARKSRLISAKDG
jgi:hypothetical protein